MVDCGGRWQSVPPCIREQLGGESFALRVQRNNQFTSSRLCVSGGTNKKLRLFRRE
jgi:hypothetical protein